MSDHLPVTVEVWPVAVDNAGLWLCSGADAWRAGPVPADSEPHDVVRQALAEHDALSVAGAALD